MSTTGDLSWGHLADSESVGRSSVSSDYIPMKYEDSFLPEYETYIQAGHCMIYSKYDEKIFGIYNARAAILMQMRFDGYLGFPGGLIDAGESVVLGLNRELVEEVNFNVKEMPITQDHHIVSHCNSNKKLILHFYAREVPLNDFKEMEKNALIAHDYGEEVMGIVRVPLYTMGDGYRGFPAFLTNAFAGNSREQLLQSLLKCNIMSQSEIDRSLNAKPM